MVPRKFRLEQFYRPRLLPQERALQAHVERGWFTHCVFAAVLLGLGRPWVKPPSHLWGPGLGIRGEEML